MPNTEALSPEQDVLFKEVYLPAFVKKCAYNGLAIHDEAGLQEALQTAAMVDMALQRTQTSSIKTASASLKSALGLDVEEQQTKQAQAKQAAVASVAKNPAVVKAVLASLNR